STWASLRVCINSRCFSLCSPCAGPRLVWPNGESSPPAGRSSSWMLISFLSFLAVLLLILAHLFQFCKREGGHKLSHTIRCDAMNSVRRRQFRDASCGGGALRRACPRFSSCGG